MKTYKSSDLTHNRAEVFAEARKAPVIINQCRTNGDIIEMFVLTHQPAMTDEDVKEFMREINGNLPELIINPPKGSDVVWKDYKGDL